MRDARVDAIAVVVSALRELGAPETEIAWQVGMMEARIAHGDAMRAMLGEDAPLRGHDADEERALYDETHERICGVCGGKHASRLVIYDGRSLCADCRKAIKREELHARKESDGNRTE